MTDLYTLNPVNKLAAGVVDQSGCTSHEGLDEKQEKSVLLARRDWLKQQRWGLHPKSGDYKRYGQEMHQIDQRIIELNKRIRKEYRHKTSTLNRWVIKVLKARMSKAAWELVLKEAQELLEKENEKWEEENE
jgi:hypothetical protein